MSHMSRIVVRIVASALAIFALSGCATRKDFYAMGGSRADGSVDMAYDFRPFEKPVVNQQQAYAIAKETLKKTS